MGFVAIVFRAILAGGAAEGDRDKEVSGDSVIRAKVGESEIVITTTSRVGGAIHSLTWGGQEFINSADHGRQLQTAWNADAGITPIQSETLNPTEAGARDDGAGPTSSSKLLQLHAERNILTTLSRPAFWLKPGETSGGHPARNKILLSDHLLAKRVQIGMPGLPHAIDYRVTVTIPAGERDTSCVMEALTGYMPPEFEKFWTYDASKNELDSLDDGPGEQTLPIVFSTADGRFAMGTFSPARTRRGAKLVLATAGGNSKLSRL